MYAGSKYESHYTVWTAWISIRVRVRVYFILQNLAPPGTTVHVPTAVLEEQVRKHCKGQRLPSFPRIKLKNHLPLVVGEMKLPQRCCEAFVEYLRRTGTELDLKRGISII